eukprot:TRINITY_DN11337_c2_g1_i1.p1 TRINITY_DN11337_c2_g1~~TRINITY_DN11337_c2_g1_i1.p1  ORF type:complete len:547 (-),score=64.28 TRINITY_DN11337_c2_g1_i1:94-1734(-)
MRSYLGTMPNNRKRRGELAAAPLPSPVVGVSSDAYKRHGDVDWGTQASPSLDELTTLSVDSALADLGLGRKVWRRFVAEVRVENDLLASVVDMWRRDAKRVESALARTLPDSHTARAVAHRFAVVAEMFASADTSKHPSEWRVVADDDLKQRTGEATKLNDHDNAGTVAQRSNAPSLIGVRQRIPRMPLDGEHSFDNREERRTALWRRLQLLLSPADISALAAAGTALRSRGSEGASKYLSAVWKIVFRQDDAEELLIELICTQSDLALQLALRRNLPSCGEDAPNARPSSAQRSVRRRGSCDDAMKITFLPDLQLFHVLSFCPFAKELTSFATTSVDMRLVAEADFLWLLAWEQFFKSDQPRSSPKPQTGVRERMLKRISSLCCECRSFTEFEHAILGCRLCDLCERKHPRYALIRSDYVKKEFQLPLNAQTSLPSFLGATGRVFLRRDVEKLAGRFHASDTKLRALRAQNDLGFTVAGRQRTRNPLRSSSGAVGRGGGGGSGYGGSNSRRVQSNFVDDNDPCCFEATALRRAHDDSCRSWWDES